jgi:hypothetical protein
VPRPNDRRVTKERAARSRPSSIARPLSGGGDARHCNERSASRHNCEIVARGAKGLYFACPWRFALWLASQAHSQRPAPYSSLAWARGAVRLPGGTAAVDQWRPSPPRQPQDDVAVTLARAALTPSPASKSRRCTSRRGRMRPTCWQGIKPGICAHGSGEPVTGFPQARAARMRSR